MNVIIDYLTQNGVMPPERLYEPPGTDFHPALAGAFNDEQTSRIVAILRQVRRNASGEPSGA